MRYIRFTGDVGLYNSDFSFVEAVPDCISNKELDEMANEYATENAEQYEYLLDEEREEALDAYYDSVWGSWQEISKEQYEEEC